MNSVADWLNSEEGIRWSLTHHKQFIGIFEVKNDDGNPEFNSGLRDLWQADVYSIARI